MEKSKSKKTFDFIEVALSISGKEFFVVYMYPQGLQMRSYDSHNGSFNRVCVTDWLSLDFAHLLAVRLHALNPSQFRILGLAPYKPSIEHPCPIFNANSLPDSWTSPFIHLLASYFVNNL